MNQYLELQAESILQVPLDKYEKNFTFFVNGESFQTNKFIADLLSPIISNIHRTDPTIDKFTIDTRTKGDFQRFLSLINFKKMELSEKDLSFFLEIIDKLGTKKIDLKINPIDLTTENILDRLQIHSLSRNFYQQEYQNEIDFFSKNFHEISEKNDQNLYNFSPSIFEDVFTNDNFQIETEDELLNFVNRLYSKSNEYSNLYEYVCFSNVTVECIENFLSIFNIKDLSQGTWTSLSKRLKKQVHGQESVTRKPPHSNKAEIQSNQTNQVKHPNKNGEIENNKNGPINDSDQNIIRNESNKNSPINENNQNGLNNENNESNQISQYNENNESTVNNENVKNNDAKSGESFTELLYSNNDFDGIFNFLQKNSDIDDEVKITFSSFNYGQPENIIQPNNDDCFGTGNKSNSWICFEFSKRLVVPKSYTLKSCDYGEKWLHPKSWVVEGSMDSNEWKIIDKQEDTSVLRGANIVHTFEIKNNDEFKFLRIRQTDHNWKNNNCFYLNCIEFYGLIK